MRWIVFVSLILGAGCSAAATAEQPSTEQSATASEARALAAAAGAAVHVDLVELEADLVTFAARLSPAAAPTLVVRYIANTGGSGVARRDACEQGARSGGAWAEGTQVRKLDARGASCVGWSLVAGPGEQSWVRDEYLSTERPPARVAAPSQPAPAPHPAIPPRDQSQMFVFGTAPPGSFVAVYVGNRFCEAALADPVVGLWGTDIGPGDLCDPRLGEPFVFAIDGSLAHASAALTWAPSATAEVALTP